MLKRFIFDLDGTLLDSDFSESEKYLKEVLGKDYERFHGSLQTYLDKYERTERRYEVDKLCHYLTREMGIRITPEILNNWLDANTNGNNTPKYGVVEALDELKRDGKSLVVLTNWFSREQIPRLDKAGIIDYFDEIITGDIALKPHKESYMIAKGEFDPSECVVIGDNLDFDYVKPKSLGMHSVLIDEGDVYHHTISKVKNLRKLKKTLGGIYGE